MREAAFQMEVADKKYAPADKSDLRNIRKHEERRALQEKKQ